MNTKRSLVRLLFPAVALAACRAPAEIELQGWRGGQLVWSNSAFTAGGFYNIEWSSALETWRGDWSAQSLIPATGAIQSAEAPLAYRVEGVFPLTTTNETEWAAMYSNAVADAAVALPEETSLRLTAVTPYNTNLFWRTHNETVQVLVASFMSGWAASNFYLLGETNITGGDQWVTVCPELKAFCRQYAGAGASARLLRIKQVLGMPPTSGNDTIVEFWVDPAYLYRPAPDPEINDGSAGLVFSTNSPYLASRQNLNTNYATWYNNTYDTRNYGMAGGVYNAWPWTRLGYTYDWGMPAGHPFGLSEFVLPNWRAWPDGNKSVAIEVVTVVLATEYGQD